MMSFTLITTLALLGTVGGFLAGLLGFGGGVLMFPLLYYVPPLLNFARLDAQTVAAMVVSQVFFSSMVGGMAHLRRGRVQSRIALLAGIVSAIGSFAGGVASKWTSERFLLFLFGIVTVLVLCMMLLPRPQKMTEEDSLDSVKIPTIALTLCSIAVGVIIGFLGAGNFVFVPLLIYIFKVPTRIAIGSTLFIALMNTATGFVAKLVTGQIPFLAAAVVICGGGIGALAGEIVHCRVPAKALRIIYAAMVALIAVRVWLTILGLYG